MYITQRKKEKIWKIIHITSYVFNGLFLLLLLIGLCGCSSTSNNEEYHKQRTTNTIQRKLDLKEDVDEWNGIENYIWRDSYYFYVSLSFIGTYDFVNLYTTAYDFNTTLGYGAQFKTGSYGSVVSYTGFSYDFNINSIYYSHSTTTFELDRIRFKANTTNDTANPYIEIVYKTLDKVCYQLNYYYSSSTRYTFNYLKLSQYNSTMIDTFNNYIDSLAPSSGGGSSGGSVSDAEQSNIINLGVDYNPLNLLNLPLYQSGYLAQGSSMIGNNALALTGLSFKSNGLIFDTIRVSYLSLNSINFSFDNGVTILNVADYSSFNGFIFPLLMQYQNSVDNTSVNVFSTPLNISNTGTNYYSISMKIWTNNEYQKIEIISDEQTIMRDNMTTKQLLQIQGSIDSSVIGGYSPFTLFSSAFTSISSILNIAILPGITIGLLLFMPLLVVIITLIFKLVKK